MVPALPPRHMPHLQAVETRRMSPGLREVRYSMCTVLERGLLDAGTQQTAAPGKSTVPRYRALALGYAALSSKQRPQSLPAEPGISSRQPDQRVLDAPCNHELSEKSVLSRAMAGPLNQYRYLRAGLSANAHRVALKQVLKHPLESETLRLSVSLLQVCAV